MINHIITILNQPAMGNHDSEPGLQVAPQPDQEVAEGRPRRPKVSRSLGRRFGGTLLAAVAATGIAACAPDGKNQDTNNEPGVEECDGLERFDPLCGVRLDAYDRKGVRMLVLRAINKAAPGEEVGVNITTLGPDGSVVNVFDFTATTPDVSFEMNGEGAASAEIAIGDNPPATVDVAPVTNF